MATRYDPFRDVDRVFNSVLRQVPANPGMPLDLYRDGDEFVAELDLPGVDPASIDIDVEEHTLTISAKRDAHTGEHVQWLSHERPTGTFARQLTLGNGVALDGIKASYRDGVLTLTIPVAEAAKPRKISVAVDNSAPTTIEGESTESGGTRTVPEPANA